MVTPCLRAGHGMSAPASNKEWQHWGRVDPLFAVATRPGRERGGGRPWTLEEFAESGRVYFADVWGQWSQYGVTPGHCVEIGCGAGRMTRQLAQRFQRVTGLDVSPDQLELARRMVDGCAAAVELTCVTSASIPLPEASVDAVYSCEVFQHFDSEAPFYDYLSEMFRVLVPGGSGCFHVPIRGLGASARLSSPLRTGLLKLARLLGRRRMMIYRAFRGDEVSARLANLGFVNVEIRVFQAGDERAAHFFARKP
jgi:SAM-dependent methyltransferase